MPQVEDKGRSQQSGAFHRILNEVGSGYPLRQSLIKKIQERTKGKLISYVAVLTGAPGTDINAVDIHALADLVQVAGVGEPLDLLINSFGGSPDVAEKVIELCRGTGRRFRVIVPNFAKSAATLIALGADEVLMSDTSQLGPIDPQFVHVVKPGQAILMPAHSIIQSYEQLVKRINEQGQILPSDVPLLTGIDLAYVDLARTAVARGESLAKKWLKQYMLGGRDAQADAAVELLLGRTEYLSHGQVINWQEARDRLHLNITYIDPQNELWEWIWELYVRSDTFLNQTQHGKLFENENISIGMRIQVVRQT